MALPIYVHELSNPEIMDTLPLFAKKGGIIQVKITFTPCIAPVRTAESKTDKTALFPVNTASRSADKAPVANIVAAHTIGFFSLFL